MTLWSWLTFKYWILLVFQLRSKDRGGRVFVTHYFEFWDLQENNYNNNQFFGCITSFYIFEGGDFGSSQFSIINLSNSYYIFLCHVSPCVSLYPSVKSSHTCICIDWSSLLFHHLNYYHSSSFQVGFLIFFVHTHLSVKSNFLWSFFLTISPWNSYL